MEKSRKQNNRLVKIAKDEKSGHLDSLQNVGAKVGHQHHRKTSTLDKIQNIVL